MARIFTILTCFERTVPGGTGFCERSVLWVSRPYSALTFTFELTGEPKYDKVQTDHGQKQSVANQ